MGFFFSSAANSPCQRPGSLGRWVRDHLHQGWEHRDGGTLVLCGGFAETQQPKELDVLPAQEVMGLLLPPCRSEMDPNVHPGLP